MRYTTYEQDQIEAILYYQYRIDKAWEELLKRHSIKGLVQKLAKVRESREQSITTLR